MRYVIAALACLAAGPLAAQDFSEGSKAKGWGLIAEKKAKFEAKVVDLVCEFSGDCPADCGAGKRQFGLIRTADNVMVLPLKNGQRSFAGAAVELLPYCNQTVVVDGLLLEDEDYGFKNVYMVQFVQGPNDEKPVKGNKWSKNWAKEHPEAKGKGPWFRRDPRVKEIIATEGYLGLGLDVDKTFIEENF
ncbi:MAG: hypothetical protein HRU30_07565 [Rhodobacteraceae bacterium]|nr:hypothetical protein [Paracoccaceae bacterium]